ncbi:hypothetical protein ACFWF9_04285 [Streptomyces roseolus]|uniref:hypothetical protein n=1 Tax=Streptomyces roseolus TaxID=67358 RepID=UPI00365E51B7
MSTDSIDIAMHAGVLSDGLCEQLAVVGQRGIAGFSDDRPVSASLVRSRLANALAGAPPALVLARAGEELVGWCAVRHPEPHLLVWCGLRLVQPEEAVLIFDVDGVLHDSPRPSLALLPGRPRGDGVAEAARPGRPEGAAAHLLGRAQSVADPLDPVRDGRAVLPAARTAD